MALIETLLLLAGLAAAVYKWARHSHTYWQRKGVPSVKSTLLLGNTKAMCTVKNSFGLHLSEIYDEPAMKNEAAVGLYILNKPALLLRDTELIKSVLIKDFNKFSNRYAHGNPHDDPLGTKNLFFVPNPQWRELRVKLSPVFTSGKMKQIYPLMLEIAAELETHLARKVGATNRFTEDVAEFCTLFTIDMICMVSFGMRANSLHNPDGEFRKQSRKHFNFTRWRSYQVFVAMFLPEWASILKVKCFRKGFSDFLRESINFVMKDRESSSSRRNDLIDILIGLKKEAALDKDAKDLTMNSDFLVAQAGFFFTAGSGTSSSTMSFTLYELAKHPEVQQRLREEINAALIAENGQLSYETIHGLEYLSMVIDEVLRLYPILPFLDRKYDASTDAEKFNLKPHYDYELEHEMAILIPVYGLQRDPKYWPNPDKFDPERFSAENRQHINPMAYLPFGSGPHNCIGRRIGLLQAKLGLVHFLKNHFVQPCANTVKEIKFDPKAFVLQFKTGVQLEVINDGLYDEQVAAKN